MNGTMVDRREFLTSAAAAGALAGAGQWPALAADDQRDARRVVGNAVNDARTVAQAGATGPLLVREYPLSKPMSNGVRARWYFGKHTAWAAGPANSKVYGFGGDGTSYYSPAGWYHSGGCGYSSYDFSTDTFQEEYATGGYSGKEFPSRLDYAPVCWDSTRQVFWQVGGYNYFTGAHTSQGVTFPGTMVPNRAWTFNPAVAVQDRFVNKWAAPSWNNAAIVGSAAEQFAISHDPVTDRLYAAQSSGNALRWMSCVDGTEGSITMTSVGGASWSSQFSLTRPQFVDTFTNEIFWMDLFGGKLFATGLPGPNAGKTRQIASGFPKVYFGPDDTHTFYIPRAGQAGIFVYAVNKGIGGTQPIYYIDCTTGVVTGSLYDVTRYAVNQGAYCPSADKILMLGCNGGIGLHEYEIHAPTARPVPLPAYLSGKAVEEWAQVPNTRLTNDFGTSADFDTNIVAKGLTHSLFTGGRSNANGYTAYSGSTLRKRSSSILFAASGGGIARAGNDIIELPLEEKAPQWRTILPSEPASAFQSAARFSITAVSRAAQCIVTAPGHQFVAGDPVGTLYPGGFGGTRVPELDPGRWLVGPVVAGVSFELRTLANSAVNSTRWVEYTGGATLNPGAPLRTRTGKPNAAHNYRSLHYSDYRDELWRIMSKNHWVSDSGFSPYWERWKWGTAAWGTPGASVPFDNRWGTDLPNQAMDNHSESIYLLWYHGSGGQHIIQPYYHIANSEFTPGHLQRAVARTANTGFSEPDFGRKVLPFLTNREASHVGGVVWHWTNYAENRLTWFGIRGTRPYIGTLMVNWSGSLQNYKEVTMTGPDVGDFTGPDIQFWGRKGVVWDPDNERYVIFYPANARLYSFKFTKVIHDPTNDTMVVTRIGTGRGPSFTSGDGIYSRLMHVPRLRAIALVNHGTENVFVMRMK